MTIGTKRIAYIGIKGLPSQAGADRVVEAIVRNLNLGRYEVTVYCSSQASPPNAHIPGIRLIRLPVWAGKHLHAVSLFVMSALHAIIFGRYDLVHLHNVEASFVAPLLRLRYRVIATSHGAAQANDKWGRLAKTLIRLTEYPFILFANALTCVSQPLTNYYEQVYRREVHYLPNGVNLHVTADTDAATALLAEHGVKPGDYLLFAAGRIMATKGCHLVIEAFRQLNPDTHLVIVGDTSHNPEYAQQLQAMANERVHFISFIATPSTLFGLVRNARLFIFPSLIEAMSMMLLEVASLGAPLICSDIPQNTSVLPAGTLTFTSGDAHDLRDKLAWALAHPAEMQARAATNQRWVHEHYGWNDIVKQYEALYETV
jgi:glycosyltransferase involved in cell wall biosynthesis